jgi:transposase-like protein
MMNCPKCGSDKVEQTIYFNWKCQDCKLLWNDYEQERAK